MKRLFVCALALMMAGCSEKGKATGNPLIDKWGMTADEECECNLPSCLSLFTVRDAIVYERGVLITIYCSVKCMDKDTEEMLAMFDARRKN